MIRRRRRNREVHFNFDCFLDLVTNVVGIVLRLILVAWVGARSYSSITKLAEVDSVPDAAPAIVQLAELPPPDLKDDPLHPAIARLQQSLDDRKSTVAVKLQELSHWSLEQDKLKDELNRVAEEKQRLAAEGAKIEEAAKVYNAQLEGASLSLEELRSRGQILAAELKALAAQPVPSKVLKYHTPVSRKVQGEEVFFECKGGRVTFIDLPAFLDEVKKSLPDKVEQLRSSWEVELLTRPIGPYQLEYTIERVKGFLDANTPNPQGDFRYGVSRWIVKPLQAVRGETLPMALAGNSEFRSIVEGVDPTSSVVTLWVYPDSFGLFRQLRDYLYELNFQVVGRPLPDDQPIAASRSGTASRGQ